MKRIALLVAVLLVAVLLSACAASANSAAGAGPNAAGFWQGLWQGFILLFTFFISLFNHNVGIYEIHNNGGWYNFGFLLGASAVFGGGCKASSCRPCRVPPDPRT